MRARAVGPAHDPMARATSALRPLDSAFASTPRPRSGLVTSRPAGGGRVSVPTAKVLPSTSTDTLVTFAVSASFWPAVHRTANATASARTTRPSLPTPSAGGVSEPRA